MKKKTNNLTAKDIMTQEVLGVRPDWSLGRLSEFLVEKSISGAPVTAEDGTLIGVVSVTDILCNNIVSGNNSQSYESQEFYLHALHRQFSPQEVKSLHFENEPQFTVRDIMTHKIFKVDEDTAIQVVADTMIRGHIHRVLVTSGGKLTGIISAVDMLKIIREM